MLIIIPHFIPHTQEEIQGYALPGSPWGRTGAGTPRQQRKTRKGLKPADCDGEGGRGNIALRKPAATLMSKKAG